MSWQVYKALCPFKVISFDLDDTIYPNEAVIRRAEQVFLETVRNFDPVLTMLDSAQWQAVRQQVMQNNPYLAGDVTALREQALALLLQQANIAAVDQCVTQAMDTFLEARNQVSIPKENIRLLEQLAKHYQLVAITNGNVSVDQIGLAPYFKKVIRPAGQHRAKPYPDLFYAMAHFCQLQSMTEMVHVGDHTVTDVQGALHAGAQAIWLDTGKEQALTQLPHVRITSLSQLTSFLLQA